MTAPLPYDDIPEAPTMFVARTFAQTELPHGKEQGEVLSVAIGTEQVVAVVIPASVPSQFTMSSVNVVPSDYRKVIVQLKIADPP